MAFSALIFSTGFAIWATKHTSAKAGEPLKDNVLPINENSKIVFTEKTLYAGRDVGFYCGVVRGLADCQCEIETAVTLNSSFYSLKQIN